MLHCVDDMSHGNTTARTVEAIAARLGLRHHLDLHEADAYEFASTWPLLFPRGLPDGPPPLDLVWLDFGVGTSGKLDELLRAWWPRLRPGGLLLAYHAGLATLADLLTDLVAGDRGRVLFGAHLPASVPCTRRPRWGDIGDLDRDRRRRRRRMLTP